MKKHLPGFVPVNYKEAGIALLIIGLLSLIVKLLSYVTGWFALSNIILYFSIITIIAGLYTFFVVPKE